VTGWITPIERMEAASSFNPSSLNALRGWSGLGIILSSSTSLMEDEPLASLSLKVISASKPLPNAFFFAIFDRVMGAKLGFFFDKLLCQLHVVDGSTGTGIIHQCRLGMAL